jgi:hypothetical protein
MNLKKRSHNFFFLFAIGFPNCPKNKLPIFIKINGPGLVQKRYVRAQWQW